MLPSNLFLKELLEDFKGRKSLAMKFLLPLVLLGPVVLAPIPVALKAGIFAFMILFLGVFGAAVGMVRMREQKVTDRLAIIPVRSSTLIMQYVIANTVTDVLQLSIPLVLFLAVSTPTPVAFWIPLIYVLAVLAANLIGALVALAASSSGEVHLYAIIVTLGIAVISGIFFALPGGFNAIGLFIPFRSFSDALLAGSGIQVGLGFLIAPLPVAILALAAVRLSGRFFKIK
jgi:ABC-2 type transport system permease protein